MAKFRKKPVIIEAIQFDPFNEHRLKLPNGVHCINSPGADNYSYEGNVFFVITIHRQRADVVSGDWIIPELDGIHYYPCKPDIFELTYEKVEQNRECPNCAFIICDFEYNQLNNKHFYCPNCGEVKFLEFKIIKD